MDVREKSLRNKRQTWEVNISKDALDTVNPIRLVVESMNIEPNPDKKLIPLSIGKRLTM